jgi:uncharacterized membrane protein (DUF4010 family)
MDTAVLERLALALAIGLLIGIERGWAEREGPKGSRTAGIRTFTLIGLLGGIMAALVPMAGPWPLALVGLAFCVAFAAFAWREAVADNSFSVTSTVAGILTYALGAFAVLGDVTAAGAAGVAVAGLLAARTPLHDFVRRLSWQELRSAILLLAMTVILLPLLPREAIDPWGAIIPYEVWLLVILIATVSFIGYLAVRLLGETRGLATAAAAGALVSSTAVTLSNARLAKLHPNNGSRLAGAIALAWAVSLLRMTAVACALNYALLLPLGIPSAGAALALIGASAMFFARGGGSAEGKRFSLSNPFELKTVFVFGFILALVLAASKILIEQFGAGGLFAFAAISGLVDVDPIVLSSARLAGDSVTTAHAAFAILIAATANIVAKSLIAVSAGGLRFGIPLGLAGIAALALGLCVWLAAAHFLPGLMQPDPLCCG